MHMSYVKSGQLWRLHKSTLRLAIIKEKEELEYVHKVDAS